MKSFAELLKEMTDEQWLEVIDKSSERQQALLQEYKERATNLALYGNSWTNEELEFILKEKQSEN